MKLLVLGGTKFLGRHVVEAALARGDEVTIFTRGQTNPELFPEVERLRGDRDGDLSALAGRSWDAVVDTSGYVPRVVRASAEFLRDSVAHYTFISSISVYRDFQAPGFDEEAPVADLDDPESEDVEAYYGALKAACERVVEEVFPGRSASIRAGLIVGPHDPTDRFTYWPLRVARGGRVLAPGPPDRPVQFIDVRDLAEWILDVAAASTTGAFNATGPVPAVTMGEVLETCRDVAESDARLVWVDEQFLLERGVGEWMELPLWLAETNAEVAHMLSADVSAAVEAGLRFRPVSETVRATLEWALGERDRAAPLASGVEIGRAGMDPEREAALLAEWDARS